MEVDGFVLRKEMKHVLGKPMDSLNEEEKRYKRAYFQYKYHDRMNKMTPDELVIFRQKARSASMRFYNGRREDHNLVLLLKEKLLVD